MKAQAKGRYLLLSGIVLLLAWLATWQLPKLNLQNHLTAFFPAPQTPEQALLQSTLRQALAQPMQAQPVMLALRLPPTADMAALIQASQQFQAVLQAQSFVIKVENQPPALNRLQGGELHSYRYLLTPSDFSEASLTQALQTLWQAWQLGIVPDKASALADPTQQWLRYAAQLQAQTPLAVRNGYWVAQDAQGTAALLLVTLQADAQAVEQFWTALQTIQAQQPHWQIQASSPALIAWQARQSIEQSIQQLSLMAMLTVLLFLGWRLRHPLWVVLSFMPLAAGALLAVLAVQAWFGYVEALALALGAVLIGVAVDYPIHAFSARREGVQAEAQAWPLIRLGALTTTAGFATLFVLGSDGLLQMALFAVVGLLTALAATRLLLWSLPRAKMPQSGVSAPVSATPRAFTLAASTHNRYALGFLWALLALAAWPLSQDWHWQDDLASLSPVPEALLQQDGALRRQFMQAEAGQFMLVSAPDVETLLQRQEALLPGLLNLQQQGVMAGKTMLADLLPSAALQHARQQQLPATQTLQTALNAALQQAQTPLQAKHFDGFIRALEHAKTLAPLELADFNAKAADWQTTLAQALLAQEANGVVGKILLHGVADKAQLRLWAEANDLVWFDQRTLVSNSVTALRNQLWQALAGFLAVILLVVWGSRVWGMWGQSRRSAWLKAFYPACSVLIPVVLGLSFAYAVLLALGQVLTVFHLLASLLLIGIGVDYSLFAQSAQRHGQAALRSVNAALWTTLLTFAFLLLTPIPILVAIGQMMVVGVLAIYLSARLFFRV